MHGYGEKGSGGLSGRILGDLLEGLGGLFGSCGGALWYCFVLYYYIESRDCMFEDMFEWRGEEEEKIGIVTNSRKSDWLFELEFTVRGILVL